MSQPPFPPVPPGPPPLPSNFVDYRSPVTQNGKPNPFAALGIASLIIGLLSIAASGFGSYLWWSWYAGSVRPPAPAAIRSGPPLPPATLTPYRPGTLRPGGLPAETRAAITKATDLRGPYAEQRRALLDTVLSEIGVAVMAGHESAQLKTFAPSNPLQENRADYLMYFVVPGGRLDLGTTVAIFHLYGTIQQTAVVPGRLQAPGGLIFTRSAIDQCISKLRSDFPQTTDQQAAFIAGELDKPRFELGADWMMNPLTPADMLKKPSMQPGNILDAVVYREGYYILPDGRATRKLAAPAGLDPATGGPIIPVSPFRPIMPGSPQLMCALSVYCAFVVVLALFLIAAGVVTFINPFKGLQLHLCFCGLKIACILLEICLSVAFFNSVRSRPSDAIRPFDTAAGNQGVITTVIVQSIYPVVILSVFASTQKSRRRDEIG
jgi:hypothetical protein